MRWWQLVKEDFQTVFERDPATQSAWQVLTLHTGFWAVMTYRLEHALWLMGWRWLARWLSIVSRLFTGVEIHPAVKAGRRLFIDHGMGVVIGETAELGNDVSIYQGVTLGGTSWAQTKRHPTIGNNVIIGAGAKVIGAITLADNVRVGSNAVVVKDVPAHTTVVGIPARAVKPKVDDCERFEAYAQSNEELDPIMATLEKLHARICALEAENKRLRLEDSRSRINHE
ncbi:serine O-acetyltransferase [Suttonella ornithocola]|uniref:Serine acetyltransferase n=1 Tax=Suttonella ornithocola TaxID=279832 RepID=A0A380MTY3_9GAMM|nr:serine O-acetyltransferase [Suttonella ornithocola]SUO95516.1 Serine acetyltransferase [Suttonella ornithocola]